MMRKAWERGGILSLGYCVVQKNPLRLRIPQQQGLSIIIHFLKKLGQY